jgi:hypothetical protein
MEEARTQSILAGGYSVQLVVVAIARTQVYYLYEDSKLRREV